MPTRLHSCATFEKGCAIVVQQGSQKANMEDLKAKIEASRAKIAALQAKMKGGEDTAKPLSVRGAPAIAKASGAYVAGVPIRNLGSMEGQSFDELNGADGSKKNDDGDGSLLPRTKTDASVLQTPPIDSQWRLEASPPEGVKKPSQHLPELSPAPSAAPETSETPSGYSPSSRKSSAPRSEKNFDKYYHACHRYCKPRKGGVSKASKGALELWHDKKGGGRKKLQDLLRQHGNFKMVELKIARWSQTVHSTNIGGRWCTKKYLAEVMHYTKDMIDNSFNHAKTQGLYRKNAVHGEEEARLVLDDTFNNKNEKGEATNLSSNGTFEDEAGDLWDSEFPDDTAPTAEDAERAAHAAAVAASAASAGSKLVFPTLQRNDSPFTILPTYIAVLGKKIDHGTTQKERLGKIDNDRARSLVRQMDTLLGNLNSYYSQLNDLQAEYLAADPSQGLEKRKADVMDAFTKCTKDDVSLNNFLARAKNMKPAAPSSAKTPEKKPKTKKEKSKAKAKVAKAAKADVEDPAAPRKSKKRKGE